MRTLIKSAAVASCLFAAVGVASVPAQADGFAIGINSAHGDHRGNVISVGFGNVAFGYRDGYWDNAHRWHRWRNAREHRNYRRHYSGGYSDWNHDRDGGDGWRRDGNDDRRGHRDRHN